MVEGQSGTGRRSAELVSWQSWDWWDFAKLEMELLSIVGYVRQLAITVYAEFVLD